MRSRRLLAISFAICAFLTTGLFAQQMSEKKDLAVFKLNYYGAPVYQPTQSVTVTTTIGRSSVSVTMQSSGKPDVDRLFQQTIGQVDQTIQQVFFDLGRFNIIQMPQRLGTDDVQDFVNAIKDFKEKNLKIPSAVSLGQQIFTEADFNKLVGSFVIVIPTVTFYDLTYSTRYEATITTSFSVVDVSTNQLIGQFKIDTSGSDDKSDAQAMRQAVNAIPTQLTYEVRKIPAFQIATGITDFVGADVVLEFGKNMGLQLGDEYNIFKTEQIGAYSSEKATGLLIIKDVRDQFSIAQVIYADPPAKIGDQLKEAPRLGVDISPYVDLMFALSRSGVDTSSSLGASLGARAVLSRGFFGLRPMVGVEITPLANSFPLASLLGFLPVSIYAGGEYNLYLGRLKVVPEVGVGAVGYLSLNDLANGADPADAFYLSHIRAHAKLNLTFLLADNLEIGAHVGFLYGIPIDRRLSGDPIAGLVAGAMVTFK